MTNLLITFDPNLAMLVAFCILLTGSGLAAGYALGLRHALAYRAAADDELHRYEGCD